MSILGDQAAADLATAFGDLASPVTFTAPVGDPVISASAIVNRTTMGTDLMTGEKVAAKRSSLTCLLAELTTMPADGWRVDGTDLVGVFVAYVQGDPLPDLSLGTVTIMLRT